MIVSETYLMNGRMDREILKKSIVLMGTPQENEIYKDYLLHNQYVFNTHSEEIDEGVEINVYVCDFDLEKLNYIIATLPIKFKYNDKIYEPNDERDFIDVSKYQKESSALQQEQIKEGVTLFYRKAQVSKELNHKYFAVETDKRIVFFLPLRYINGKNKTIKVTAFKNYIEIPEGKRKGLIMNSFPTYKLSESEYHIGMIPGKIFISDYEISQLKNGFYNCFEVENINDLKIILGDYYEDFCSLFNIIQSEYSIAIETTDNYEKRKKEEEKIASENYVPTEAEIIRKNKIENEKELKEHIINDDYMTPFNFKESELVRDLSNRYKNNLNYDPTSSFYISIISSFVEDFPYSMDPMQKDSYIPLALFYNKKPSIINQRSFFRYSDSKTLYKALTSNYSLTSTGVAIQLCAIFQRVLLGEIEPTEKAMLDEFLALDCTDTYKRDYNDTIHGIINIMVSEFGNITDAKTMEERRSSLDKIYLQIINIVGPLNKIEDKFYHRLYSYSRKRDNEICNKILSQQLDMIKEDNIVK